VTFPRLTLEEHIELQKLRSGYPEWEFSAVSGRWVAEKHMEDVLIVIEKQDPQSLRSRVEYYDSSG
jgi:hypothetical protein